MNVVLRRLMVFTFYILLTAGGSRAQGYFFTRYPIEAGLSQSVVNCVFQDKQGYVWAGTQNGLNRFNGYSFEVFLSKSSDTSTISNNWIYSIDEDRQGNLWIGTKNGLNQYIRKEKRFRKINWESDFTSSVSKYIYDARVSRSGKILINTPPVLTIYDPGTGASRQYISKLVYDGAVKDNRIPLLEDRDGMIWIGSTKGLACFNPLTEKFMYFLPGGKNHNAICDEVITALYEGPDGRLWIGTPNGMNLYDKQRRIMYVIRHDPFDPHSINSNFIRTITGDRYNSYWIGTEGGGLDHFVLRNDTLSTIKRFTDETHGLGHNIVLSLMVDHSDNLWIGTLQGLAKTDLKPRKFRLYRKDSTPSSVDLLGNVIASIYKDNRGQIWVGNWGQGLNIVNRATGQVEHYSSMLSGKNHIPNDFIHVIFPDAKQNIWIGTRDGILVYDRNSNSFLRFREFFRNTSMPELRGVRIYMIIRSRDGSHWVATQSGLYHICPMVKNTEVFTAEAHEKYRIGSNLVYDLLEDRDGLIWIATLGGVDVYDPVKKVFHHFRNEPGNSNSLCDNVSTTLCEDRNGDIWIGTNSYVNRFSKRDSSFAYYAQKSGFPSNLVYDILKDGRQNLWFATGNGLCRFDTNTGRFRTYSVDEGLQSKEFNLHSSYKSNDGEVFFGGMNGFNSFYPDSLGVNSYLPEIVITSCYKTTKAENVYLNIEGAEEIEFNYNEHTFTIEFAALEFTRPENNQYAYKLEGMSDDWIETGTRHFVPFSNLPPGEYIFRVKGSNNDGVWNESGPALKIIIHPPWWRSTWAWTVYILLLVTGIFLFIRIRERTLIRERNLLEKKVHLRTLQIEEQNRELTSLNNTKDKFFSIIAHDLRNPFNTILGLSEMILGNIGKPDPEKIRKSVTDIRDTSKHTFDLLQNLLIWARSQTNSLDFKPVSFDLSERIRENLDLVKGQAERKNIEFSFHEECKMMATGDTRMIDTILRNLLSNAIKFTPREGKVTVTVTDHSDGSEVTVADTGTGIAKENIAKLFQPDSKFTRKGTDQEKGSGLGLLLCHEFITKHKGTIRVESEPGKGSRFIFTLPKPRID